MTVEDAFHAGRYDNKVPYHVEKVPVDEDRMTVRQAKEHSAAEKERQNTQRRLHREEDYRLTALLRSDLEVEHGMVGHPKAERLWSMAWERGHSSGYLDVIYHYDDLADLLK